MLTEDSRACGNAGVRCGQSIEIGSSGGTYACDAGGGAVSESEHERWEEYYREAAQRDFEHWVYKRCDEEDAAEREMRESQLDDDIDTHSLFEALRLWILDRWDLLRYYWYGRHRRRDMRKFKRLMKRAGKQVSREHS